MLGHLFTNTKKQQNLIFLKPTFMQIRPYDSHPTKCIQDLHESLGLRRSLSSGHLDSLMARLRESFVSEVTQNLSGDAATRYKNKIKQLGLRFDPYDLKSDRFVILSTNTAVSDIPMITYPDVYHYLIEYPDHFSRKALKT